MTATITITKHRLLPALKRAASAVEGRSSLLILNNLRLVSTGEALSVTGSDLETEITARCQADGDPFETTIPARKLMSLINGLPDDAELTLRVTEDRATLTCGKFRSLLATLPAADYPSADSQDGAPIAIQSATLGALIGGVLHAGASADVRYYLNGLFLEGRDGALTAVATDGHRLAMRRHPDAPPGLDGERILPIAPAKTIHRLLHDAETATLTLWDRGLRLVVGSTTLTAKLIDGRYPDWRRVVPQNLPHTATVDRAALLAALTRCAILSNEQYKGARLEFTADELRVSARNPDQEEADETLSAACSAPCGIGFNINYLTQALSVIGTEGVLIRYSDPNTSILVLDADGDQGTALDVVMPMRL